MLFVVDGTGDWFDNDYQATMAYSFCKQLEKMASATYYRGPSIEGLLTFEKSKQVVRDIRSRMRTGPEEDIYLAGHSRGGAAVIYAAQLLNKLGIGVKAMFLYDAVDRTVDFGIDVTSVPANVRQCYHARRFPHLSELFTKDLANARQEWERAMSGGPGSSQARMKGAAYEAVKRKHMLVRQFSRSVTITEIGFTSIDFGNCGIKGEGACRYEQHFFLGTHGAIGGAAFVGHGIKELEDIDRAAMRAVDAWMSAALLKEGVMQATAK